MTAKASPLRFPQFLRRLFGEKRGNVLMIFGFAIIPLTFATGMGIDYGKAMRLQTKLNAAADAAALSAVTQQMMLQSGQAGNDTAKATAISVFNAQSQSSDMPGLTLSASSPVVTVTGNDTVTTTRTATVSWEGTSANAFAGVLGWTTLRIHGSSTATATAAPNIDFYVALDTSPSMALPTTTSGFTTMDNAVTCSFACHSNKIEQYIGSSIPGLILDNTHFAIIKGNYGTGNIGGAAIQKIDSKGTYIYTNATTTDSRCKGTANKNICIYNSDGSFVDSYWYALNQGVHLRVTDERAAVGDLMSLAQNYAQQNSRTYRAALYSFDHLTNMNNSLIATLTADLSSVTAAASNIDVVTVNDRQANGCPPTNCVNGSNNYLFTSFQSILTYLLNTAAPKGLPTKSGKGTNDPGDTPQAFLFLVTDGMSDEDIGSGRTRAQMQQAQIDQCTAIKNRGIKIAILYTEYTSDSIKDDEPNQRAIANAAIPNIAPALTKCASSSDLMYTVKTDESITDALQSLFTKAVATARISN